MMKDNFIKLMNNNKFITIVKHLLENPTAINNISFGDNTDYHLVYSKELQIMKELGYCNEDSNIIYLKKTNGNVQNAINLLLGYS